LEINLDQAINAKLDEARLDMKKNPGSVEKHKPVKDKRVNEMTPALTKKLISGLDYRIRPQDFYEKNDIKKVKKRDAPKESSFANVDREMKLPYNPHILK
jgi:hypothetical protein